MLNSPIADYCLQFLFCHCCLLVLVLRSYEHSESPEDPMNRGNIPIGQGLHVFALLHLLLVLSASFSFFFESLSLTNSSLFRALPRFFSCSRSIEGVVTRAEGLCSDGTIADELFAYLREVFELLLQETPSHNLRKHKG